MVRLGAYYPPHRGGKSNVAVVPFGQLFLANFARVVFSLVGRMTNIPAPAVRSQRITVVTIQLGIEEVRIFFKPAVARLADIMRAGTVSGSFTPLVDIVAVVFDARHNPFPLLSSEGFLALTTYYTQSQRPTQYFFKIQGSAPWTG
jgi:hypothetical protein